ncbi:hypothetical protein DQ04_00311200 [Trypanosoma grayi]|uniref:hypothetical protein n=1 Tax=Trypanosoma grayi TaxID=71804 RepID=UPI0004F4240C|nr:hypothetical protein DQ04_00311200 [Trypanosoma grayi]KEG14784.1 hypothetical protein DQ04_00311200 [Trypanosoma grayi]
MFEAPVECCECTVPVGDDGALRAVLLVPCQHLLHMGCVDYIRKRRKLDQLVGGSDCSGVAEVPTPTACSSDGRLVACPACQMPVQRLVPLFPSSGDVQRAPKAVCSDAASRFRELHHAQKTSIAHLRALHEQRERVTQLTRTCAQLHERLSAAQAEVDRMSRILPSTAPAGSISELAEAELCVGNMTATELELYITQSSVTLEGLERDVREQRWLAEKKRKKLTDLQLRYSVAKASLKRPPPTADNERDDAGSSCSEGTFDSPSGSKRPRLQPLCIDVDAEEASAKAKAVVVSPGNGSVAREDGEKDDDDKGRNEEVGSSDKNDDADEDDDVVFIEHKGPGLTSSGISSSSRRNGKANSVGAMDSAAGAWQTSLVTGPISDAVGHNDVDGGEDTMMCYTHLHRAALTLQPVRSVPNVTRLLPRREDRLWQTSLESLL